MDYGEILSALSNKEKAIAVIGLGYVGLPLALELSRHFKVVGYDKSGKRISDLRRGIDVNRESDVSELSGQLTLTDNPADLSQCPVMIIAAPTPVTPNHVPDLKPLESAMRTAGKYLHGPVIIVVESTVYPGATHEVAKRVLVDELGLTPGVDFKMGYSPERINPGDHTHGITKVTKIIAGEDAQVAGVLEGVYGAITNVYKTSSIAVAEAAKVIENIQRDINIAFMNELAIIFEKMGLDTKEVIDAASTKWNFLRFTPGLVGGHCIGVDPYYLTYCAQRFGYTPQIILAGRRLNDGMGGFIADMAVKLFAESGKKIAGARIAVLGATFKENLGDIRNSRVFDIVQVLQGYKVEVAVADPVAIPHEVEMEYGMKLTAESDLKDVDGIILAVGHDTFANRTVEDFIRITANTGKPVFIDVKSLYSAAQLPGFLYWRL